MKNPTREILKTLDLIEESKKKFISELNLIQLNKTDYSNLTFDRDQTQFDSVNKPLLDDINSAAKSVGIIATVTTALSGHPDQGTNKSRHGKQTAVDIAILDGIGAGGATNSDNGNPKFRELGNKLRDALVSMGYSSNVEVGNTKAVLWQTNTGGNHFNHLHVSNNSDYTSGQPSIIGGQTEKESGSTPQSGDTGYEVYRPDPLLAKLGSKFGADFAIKNENFITEQIQSSSIGKNCLSKYGQYFCSGESNKKVYSPVSGKVKVKKYNPSCKNTIQIEFENKGDVFYIEYCGIDSPENIIGKSVKKGDLIGKTNSDFTVTVYDLSGSKSFVDKDYFDNSERKSSYSSSDINKVHRSDPLMGTLGKIFASPFSILGDKYDKDGKRIEKRWASPTDPNQPESWFDKMSPTYSKKIKEDIERIKKMLK